LANVFEQPACPKCKGVGQLPESANQMTANLLVQIPKRFPQVRVWRQNSGALRDTTGRVVRYGIVGGGDLSGIIGPAGTRLEVEVKAGHDKMSLQQKVFKSMIERAGGVYLLCTDVETTLRDLELRIKWIDARAGGYK
jgi:hypothetical protein